MQFNETLSNYLKTRTAQFEKKMSQKKETEDPSKESSAPRELEGGVTSRLCNLLKSQSKELETDRSNNVEPASSRLNKTFTNLGHSSNLLPSKDEKTQPRHLLKTPDRLNSSRGKNPIEKLRSMLSQRNEGSRSNRQYATESLNVNTPKQKILDQTL